MCPPDGDGEGAGNVAEVARVAEWEPSRLYMPPAADEIPTVSQMVAALDESVAGLEDAKRRLSVTLRRHMLCAAHDAPERAPNLLLIGPTGGGKTITVRTLLDWLGIPWVEASVTEFSDTGYIGRSLVSMFSAFYGPRWKAKKDPWREAVALGERWGVVVLDEFDKLRGKRVAGERQVGLALQYELLKLVEGAEFLTKRDDDDRGIFFRTHHVLFIAVGAFQGLGELMLDLRGDTQSEPEAVVRGAMPGDIAEYGFIDELVGRFSSLITLPALTAASMVRIAQEHIVPVYERQMALDDITLEIDEVTLHLLAQRAMNARLGARAMQAILDDTLWRAWAQASPGDRVVLDADGLQHENARVEPCLSR